ncbi:MAG TPA: helix-turn-helix transcriptional regulator [Acidimicrobiales bacterium]|nr:helix-turn-helix transcriptional regulator [Acidimicrobiales bacterium]
MEGDLQIRFGRNLLAYREAKGLSQEAMADYLGVHRTYIGSLERGERNPSLRTVERLAEQLGVDPLSLLEKGGKRRRRPSPGSRRH